MSVAMYDLIGDIHGHATPLKRLLEKLGYRDEDGNGAWRHPERTVIFLGDFIDRGPEQLEVLRIARAMVESGAALAVMGNHEFNAVCWATESPDHPGQYLRSRDEKKNRHQHQVFLTEVVEESAQHVDIVSWFRTLPVYLDLPGLRVVHACWHAGFLKQLSPYLDANQCILDDAWPELSSKDSPGYAAIETVLKGLEIPLPGDHEFQDKDGTTRRHMRTRWWKTGQLTYHDLALMPAAEIHKIPHDPAPEDIQLGYDGEKPLFVGHYWLDGDPKPLTAHIACLDYSIARQEAGDTSPGKLCAYRWEGESELTHDKFVWVSG